MYSLFLINGQSVIKCEVNLKNLKIISLLWEETSFDKFPNLSKAEYTCPLTDGPSVKCVIYKTTTSPSFIKFE